jgi:hypothetical protein
MPPESKNTLAYAGACYFVSWQKTKSEAFLSDNAAAFAGKDCSVYLQSEICLMRMSTEVLTAAQRLILSCKRAAGQYKGSPAKRESCDRLSRPRGRQVALARRPPKLSTNKQL